MTYSPKYARYQKTIRDVQVERAEKMLNSGKIHNYLDTDKIEQEALYDGMYAVTTDLLDDDVKDILKGCANVDSILGHPHIPKIDRSQDHTIA